ncbi:unnamed protein product, partial [Callosobruchus maculatus]
MNMYPWYRDSVGGQLGQLCGPMATTIKTENGYNDCMLALDYATQSKVRTFSNKMKIYECDTTLVRKSYRYVGPQTKKYTILFVYICADDAIFEIWTLERNLREKTLSNNLARVKDT